MHSSDALRAWQQTKSPSAVKFLYLLSISASHAPASGVYLASEQALFFGI
jgi:hypothetical protein